MQRKKDSPGQSLFPGFKGFFTNGSAIIYEIKRKYLSRVQNDISNIIEQSCESVFYIQY